MKSADVIIIGGGVIGTACAYYLAKEGAEVVLLERNELASGSSGANQGNISIHNRLPGPILDLNLHSLNMYQSLSKELGFDVEFMNTCGLSLIENEHYLPLLKERLKALKTAGLDVDFVDQTELAQRFPAIANNLPGAIFCKQSSRINSLKIVYGYARGAKNLGAKLFTQTEVHSIRLNKNRVSSVLTDSGEIKSNFVVIAAGVWSPALGKTAGLNIPISPTTGHIIVTEPIDISPLPLIGELMIPNQSEPLTGGCNLQQDFKVRIVLSPTLNGNILVGRSEESKGYDTSLNQFAVEAIIRRTIRFFPLLSNISCIRVFTGLRPGTSDNFPIVDRLSQPEGIVLATGHGDKGVNLAPITGKIVTDLIIRDKTEITINPYKFNRFKGREQNAKTSN
jgi:sarcosine oxidase subunit beta